MEPTNNAADRHPSSGTLVDARELARVLGLKVAVVYRLSASGRIPRYKAGHRSVWFQVDEVLAALRVAAPPSPPPPQPPRVSRRGAEAPLNDLPPYDWSAPGVADGSLPSADRRG